MSIALTPAYGYMRSRWLDDYFPSWWDRIRKWWRGL